MRVDKAFGHFQRGGRRGAIGRGPAGSPGDTSPCLACGPGPARPPSEEIIR